MLLGCELLNTLAFLLGSLETLFAAAANAAVPALVDDEQLDRTNGLLFASETAGTELAGPAMGGLLFAAAAAIPFVGDGISFLLSALLLLGLRGRLAPPTRAAVSGTPSASRPRISTDIRAGLRFFREHQLLRLVAMLVTGLAFCQAMVMGVLVVFGLRALHLAPSGYGLFLAAGALGSVSGGLVAARVRARVGTTVVLLGSAFAAAVAYLLCGTTSSVVVAGAAFVIETFAVACGSVASLSLRQVLVPDELRGRVGNAFRMCIWGVIPLGTLAGGVLAQAVSVRAPFLVAGVAQLVLTVTCAGRLRDRVAAFEGPAVRPLASLPASA